MDTALSSKPVPTHIPTSQAGLKPCQRSCKGLMLYFPPKTVGSRENPYSWRSNEPVCLGLSAARKGPHLDLQKLHEAREIPAGRSVDFSVVFGHAVYQSNQDAQVLPPGCMTGLEFLRFSKMASAAAAGAVPESASSSTGSGDVSQGGSAASASNTMEPVTVAQSAVKAFTGSLKAFASGFRVLTSDADTNTRLSKTWTSIVEFDPQQYASKFETQAQKNYDAMSKWLRELQEAVSKPKA